MKFQRHKQEVNWKTGFYYLLWVIICLGIVGASSYPFISDFLLAQKQEAQITQFDKTNRNQSTLDYLKAFYRDRKSGKVEDPFKRNASQKNKHDVDVAASRLKTIAILAIPKIHEVLPVYDNTSATALDNGVGLLENTAPPIGGKGNHSVLTGHSGLSLNQLFTDLPKLKLGDEFYLKVNGEVHAYKVDQIKTVLPDDFRYLQTDPHQDYVTLVTCTPLFQNTHRLLVRGHRVPYHPRGDINSDGGLTSLGKGVIAAVLTSTLLYLIYRWLTKHPKQPKYGRHTGRALNGLGRKQS
ncbi:class C sortase [Limosilactobacillus reuteri]|uniref:class C sortase n=1 Tax=Limosilactobacillus reuteri TaxID=1598 RepID=UPI001E4245C3|nr:class C sortase [Limosilactobacillus reuteri]MCC4500304.1 class C sortase [Limosilactobacillus reuteri]MCC4500629.1 class C sortase [Limosilactobacillus reuteri]